MKEVENVYDLNLIILDDNYYNEVKSNLKEMIIKDYSCRKDTIYFRLNEDDTEVYNLTLSNFLTNLILLGTFNVFKERVYEEFLFDASNINKKTLSKYINEIIEYFSDYDYKVLNSSISKSIEEMADISGIVNVLQGNTMSLHGIIELSKKNEEFKDLINTTIPDGLQFDEIESYLRKRTDRLMEILMSENNVLQNYVRSGTGINTKQLSQSILNVGLKPDLFGNVIPEPINTNYLHGLRNPQDFYINAEGARKALITNFKKVKESGYLTRKLSLLKIDTELDYDYEDCGTLHLVPIHVNSPQTIKRLEGRWYVEEGGDELNLINSKIVEKSSELVDKTIYIRSPITCAHTNGRVCRTCYGDTLAKTNKGLQVGIIAVLILTNQLTQMLLSAKHLLQTRSTKINWHEKFLEYFIVDRNMITPNKFTGNLIIESDDIIDNEEDGYTYLKRFFIEEKKESIEINSELELIFTEFMMSTLKENKNGNGDIVIPFKSLNQDDILFNIVMENNELSASLQAIQELIETNDHLGCYTIEDIVNMFLNLLNESGINMNSVHAEMIINSLVRDINNPTQRLDFTKDELDPYVILRVTDAILKSPSVSVSLSFEQIKKQLNSPETYEKDGYSKVDELMG